MNRYGPHNQTNRVQDWPDAIRAMQPTAWFKFMDDVAMAKDAKAANPTVKVVGRFWRDSMQQFSQDWDASIQKARDFIGTWLNESFLEFAPYIDAVEDFNEYWAVSHTPYETQARITWIQALVSVWENEILSQQKYAHLERIKWCLGNAAIGNDMPWQVAEVACNADSGPHYIGYHGYVSVVSKDYQPSSIEAVLATSSTSFIENAEYRANFRDGDKGYPINTNIDKYRTERGIEMALAASPLNLPIPGERSPDEFYWGSGRILMKDIAEYQPRGLYPEYIITEGGLVRDANGRGWLQPNDGWNHHNVVNGNMDEYVRLISEVSDLYRGWNNNNGDRFRGYVFFTSGINDWDGFLLRGNELKELVTRTSAFAGTSPQPDPKPDPKPDPEPKPETYPVIGLDISHHQGEFDAEIAKEAGNSFVYIKASDGWVIVPSAVEPRLDPRYYQNTERCLAAGLLVGSYHFYQPSRSASEQALLFLDTISRVEEQNLPPALDLEIAPVGGFISQFQDDVYEWLQIVQDQTGQIPIIYTNPSFYNVNLNDARFDKYQIWIANWTEGSQQPYLPSRKDDWLIWQHSSLGNGGANGAQSATIDLDRFNAENIAEVYDRFGRNWMKEEEEIPELFLAPLREQYNRVLHVIKPTATREQEYAIFETARRYKQTITWSYDDAGATPCQSNTAYLWLTNPQDIYMYNEWFAKHYPDTAVVHPADEDLEIFTPADPAISPDSTFSPWWRRLVARLRRALVPL